VTVVDTLGEPVVLINNDGTPAFLAYSAKTYLGGVAPYHWLDFVNNRALYAGADVGNVTQATGYSFTRASDGYYTNSDGTLTLFGSGALRRGDRGVLIEGSRTNLLTYSQEFDDASWTDANTTVSANSTNAPDGTTTADILTATTSTSVGKSKTFTGTAAAYTCSLIAKAGTSSWLRIATSNGTSTINSWFNLSSGATGTTEAGQTSTIVPLSDGYYICSVVRTMAATTCTVFYRFANADNGVTGTSGQTQTWWGAQVELGGFVSSYIPTVAAAATRASDVLTYTAGVSYPLSLWAEFERAVDTGLFEGLVAVDDGSAANFTAMRVTTSDAFQGRIFTASVSQYAQNAGTVSLGVHKMAIRSSAASARMCYDGTLATETTGITAPATPTLLRVGAVENNNNPANNYIRRIAIVQGAVSDANLQGMTQ
jgi:hypothetical protein